MMHQNESMHESAIGARDRIRTDDLLFTRQLLYQLSYAGAESAEPLF